MMDVLFTETAATKTVEAEPASWSDMAEVLTKEEQADVEEAPVEEEILDEEEASDDGEEAEEPAEEEIPEAAEAKPADEEAPKAEKRPLIVLPEQAPPQPQWTVDQYREGMATRFLVTALKGMGYEAADDASNLREIADQVPRLDFDRALSWARGEAEKQTATYVEQQVRPFVSYQQQVRAVSVVKRMSEVFPDLDDYADDMRAGYAALVQRAPEMAHDEVAAIGWLYAEAVKKRAGAAIKQTAKKASDPKRVAVTSGGARTVKTAGRKEVDPVEILVNNASRGDRLASALGL